MRISKSDGPLTARAIAGSHVVLLAMNLPANDTEGLLGFSISRTDRATGERRWLPNYLRFERNANDAGETLSSENPVQAFVWGDYAVDPRSKLTYRVEARYGTPDKPEPRHAVELEVDVEREDDGKHGIYFNRGAAGSQAYAEKFHDKDPRKDAEAARWLSRGLEEALVAFIEGAKGSDAGLRGAFYEFEHRRVLDALHAAAGRGVDVQLVVGRPQENGKPEYPADDNVKAVAEADLDSVVTWRTLCDGIPHNKFLVRLDQGNPVAVWTGSTNITDGAFWGQSNVGHLVHDPEVAAAYLAYWSGLHEDTPTEKLRDLNDSNDPVPTEGRPTAAMSEVFSPHTGEGALRWYASLMRGSEHPPNQAVFFTAPFGISDTFEAVLKKPHPFPIYALLDKEDNHMEILRAVPGNELVAGAYLGQGQWHQFLQEALINRMNPNVRYIHTKYMLIDPLTDDPLLITGSANFSGASVSTNDENMLAVRGDTRVADIYLTEFMRLFTHMYFRARVTGDGTSAGGPHNGNSAATRAPTPVSRGDTKPLYLTPDDSWVKAWYQEDGYKKRERELFCA